MWRKTAKNKRNWQTSTKYKTLVLQYIQKTCIFHLILLGIPSSFLLPVKNMGMGGGGLLNRQNLLSVTKVICPRSFKEKIPQTLFGCYYTFVPPLGLRLGLRLALSRVSSWWVINNKRGRGYECAIAPLFEIKNK